MKKLQRIIPSGLENDIFKQVTPISEEILSNISDKVNTEDIDSEVISKIKSADEVINMKNLLM